MHFLDNPGGGNCGYYAFSIGIIQVIQAELAKGTSPLLTRLKSFAPELDEQNFKEFKFSAYNDNVNVYQRDFLDSLQATLRSIAVIGYNEDLLAVVKEEALRFKETLSLVNGNETFSKFMQVVYLQQGQQSPDIPYNELASSKKVKALATQVNNQFNSLAGFNDTNQNNDQNLVNIAKKLFSDDVLHEENIPKTDSVILSALEKINEGGYWATHDHLKQIAAKLKVNLNIDDQDVGANLDDQSTVVLKNQNNEHWTTKVGSITESPRLSANQQAIYEASSMPIKIVCQTNNISGSMILDYLHHIIINAENDTLFKVDETDTEDLKMAKQLQEEELISVGLRPKK